MIEERAVVIRCEGKYVWVQTQRQSSCGHCSVKNTCGTQVLSKVLGNKVARVRCLNSQYNIELISGDSVVIGLQESALLSGSLLIYLLPLIFMIVLGGLSVFIAKIWWPDWIDFISVVASFSGLFLGLKLSQQIAQKKIGSILPTFIQNKERHHKNTHQYEPVIIRKISSKKQQCISVPGILD